MMWIGSVRLQPDRRVTIGDRPISLARPLEWYEYAWSGLPILLTLQGGAIGALWGFVALRANAAVFRGEGSTAKKLLITGLISLGATLAYFLSVFIFLVLVFPTRS